MITDSISITNEVSSDGDDNIPSHWPTFEEVGGVRWDWDELSILSDNDDEDAEDDGDGTLSTSSRQRRTPCQQHVSSRRRRQKKARQGCILFIIAIYNIIFYAKFFHFDNNSPHLELTVKLPKSLPSSLSTSNTVQRHLRPVRPHEIRTIYPPHDNEHHKDSSYILDKYTYIKRFGRRISAQLRSYLK